MYLAMSSTSYKSVSFSTFRPTTLRAVILYSSSSSSGSSMLMESVVRSSWATGLAKVPSSSPKMFSVQITMKNRGPVMSAKSHDSGNNGSTLPSARLP